MKSVACSATRFAALLSIALVMPGLPLPEQTTPDSLPAFEVASVKKLGPPSAIPQWQVSGTNITATSATYRSLTLRDLLAAAFSLRPYQISGPDWIVSDKYDVTAKLPPDTVRSSVPAMLQRLLIERFALTFHYEQRELSQYALVVGKSGSKLQPAGEATSRRSQMRPGYLVVSKCEMHSLADLLSRFVDRPVIDQTDVKGPFDITLEWSPADNDPSAEVPAGASIFTAVQEQLGLKLEPRKLPSTTLVIDRLDRAPKPN